MHLARAFTAVAQPVARRLVIGHLRTAAKVIIRFAQRRKPALHPIRMDRGALVRCAGQRQMLGSKPVRFGGARCD